RDGVVVRFGNRPGIEEAAGIVELDVPDTGCDRGERLHGGANLGRDGARWRRARDRVLPQVAHRAAPGALGTGQEDGPDADGPAGRVGLLVDRGPGRDAEIERAIDDRPGGRDERAP